MSGEKPMPEQGPKANLDAQLQAVERITKLFRLERIVYLCFAIAAFAVLLAYLIVGLFRQEQNLDMAVAFGSSGVVTASCASVLVMWNRAMAIIVTNGGGNG